MNSKLKYKNITISGLPGAGSTTLGEALAKTLKWKYFSGGDFLRDYAIKQGTFNKNEKKHHDQSILGDESDKLVDFGMRKTLQAGKGNILDSWLSGFMAQGVEGTLKILIYCSDNSVIIDRIVNRDHLTVQEAKEHIFEREKKNVAKWKRMYHKQWEEWVVKKRILSASKSIWFWYPEMYDLVIDTYKNNKEQALRIVLKELNHTGKIDLREAFSPSFQGTHLTLIKDKIL